jgi:hypothetical protein
MPTPVRFKVDDLVLEGDLNDSDTAKALLARLPLTVRMSRWGEEYYGGIGDSLGVGEAADAREEMQVGELAYWPVGNALCVFFGPTPASSGDEPRAASNVNPVGMLTGDLDALKKLGGSIEALVERA